MRHEAPNVLLHSGLGETPMKVIVFGASGMVGQGVLRECLCDPIVGSVLAIGRSASGKQHEKLRERALADFSELPAFEADLAGLDACFFCLGVSSAGMTEADYRRVTYDLTTSIARLLVKASPAMTFVYVSGAGTDSTARGRSMWARVKGETENALLALPFKASFMFRPGFIQPLHGIVSKTKLYRAIYAVMGPLYPVLKTLAPSYVTTTENVGRAMIEVAKHGAPTSIVENRDINVLAASSASRPQPS
jgi:uncharacterized protein YbjT (DUF2867 family)